MSLAATRTGRSSRRKSGPLSGAAAAAGCFRPSSRCEREGRPRSVALLLPGAAQALVVGTGRLLGAIAVAARRLDDVVDKGVVAVPRVGVVGGVFLGGAA